MSNISINGITIDPVDQAPALRDAGLEAEDASDSNYLLVQTSAPLSRTQREELENLGAETNEYVSENTYLVHFPPQDLNAVRRLPFVVWAGVYLRIFKIPPTLLPPGVDSRELSSLADPTPHPARQFQQVDLLLQPGVTVNEDLIGQVAAAARVEPEAISAGRTKLRITTTLEQLPEIATVDEIREIQPVQARQLFNNVARDILKAEVTSNGTTYRGSGEIVAVADTGFDTGDADNPHPAFAGRVQKLYPLGRVSPGRANDPHGHGTHVAGSVLGTGQSATMGGAIEGTAPEASLILQSLLDDNGGLGGIPVDLNDLFEQTYADGARVHTNSWGLPGLNLPYDTSAREIDEFVWNHPDQVICFAAGNDGTDDDSDGVVDTNSIGSQSAAKNCITVGASESIRPGFAFSYGEYWSPNFPVDPVANDLQANDSDGMVAFSSRGPTREGRIKPDVVAPGTCILSALSRDAPPSDVFGASDDPELTFSSGTSMATPLVAGCAAVLRQSLIENGTPTPSAALVKALLINGATTLGGQYDPSEAGDSPNSHSGWGRVSLADSVVLPDMAPFAGYVEGGPLQEGEESSFTVHVPGSVADDGCSTDEQSGSSGHVLKLTLVWTDPDGPLLQNDLDLIVRASDGTERHGNTADDQFDRANNVEQVRWVDVPPGDVTVVVRAFRITQFAQPYACVWRIDGPGSVA